MVRLKVVAGVEVRKRGRGGEGTVPSGPRTTMDGTRETIILEPLQRSAGLSKVQCYPV